MAIAAVAVDVAAVRQVPDVEAETRSEYSKALRPTHGKLACVQPYAWWHHTITHHTELVGISVSPLAAFASVQ